MKAFRSIISPVFIIVGLLFGGCASKHDGDSGSQVETASADYYTCPMHPSVRSDKPGACPVCHMSLVRVSEGRSAAVGSGGSELIALSSAQIVLANVSTTQVEEAELTKVISAVGKIDIPEPSMRQITSRFGGRLESLSISYVGQQVKKGELVAEIYSPEAVSAQREFLVALTSVPATESPLDLSDPDDSGLRSRARKKLQLLDFSDQQIKDLESTRSVKTTVQIFSPIDGIVTQKRVDVQQYLSPGEALFDVADLSTVWLQFDVYESDVSFLHIGQKVRTELEAYPGDTFTGTLSFISPLVESSTRTIRARAILANHDAKLKPEMFAQAFLEVPLSRAVVVPASAVISTGKRHVVWVETEPNHFEAREVKLGHRADEKYQILQGLTEGEIIAATGAFLIDSESQLQHVNAGMDDHH